MYLLLRADQRLEQNHKDLLLPSHLQELYSSGKESGLILSQKIIFANHLSIFKTIEYSSSSWSPTSRGRWSGRILESKRLSSEQILCDLNIGMMKCGRVQWQKAEQTGKDFNIALIHQDKKFFISELFKVSFRTQSH